MTTTLAFSERDLERGTAGPGKARLGGAGQGIPEDIEGIMTVKGRNIYHCHGKNKGKLFRKYSSAKKARSAHRAIMANRKKKR